MATSFATIDDYIASFSADVQPILQQVRKTIGDVVPGAEETISYGMPTVTLDGRHLVYFAGWKNHISIYPAPVGGDSFERRIAPYRASRGTLKFPMRQPVPYDLIEEVVQVLVKQRAGADGAE